MLFKLKKNIFHSKRYLTNSIDFMYERIVIKLQGRKVKEKIEFHHQIHLFEESCHRNKSFVSRKLTNTREKKAIFFVYSKSFVNRYICNIFLQSIGESYLYQYLFRIGCSTSVRIYEDIAKIQSKILKGKNQQHFPHTWKQSFVFFLIFK